MGCACDAFKLLLSNIPVSVTETVLINALSQFGHVVQLGLTPDLAGVSVACVGGCRWFSGLSPVHVSAHVLRNLRHLHVFMCMLLWGQGRWGMRMHAWCPLVV
jgi:hypothetical protein